MPWSFVRGTSVLVSSGTSATATFASNTTAGNVLAAWSVDKSSASLAKPTFSDNGGNAWTASSAVGMASAFGTVSFGWAIAVGGNAPTVTVAWPGAAGTLEIYIAEFVPPSVATYGLAVDVAPTMNTGSGTTWSGPALPMSGTSDLCLSLTVYTTSWTTTTTPWVSVGSQQGDEAAYALNQSGTSTPSGTNSSGTWSTVDMALMLGGPPPVPTQSNLRATMKARLN